MNDPREGCVAVRVVPNAAGTDFTVAAERNCIAPTGCWWPKCTCEPCDRALVEGGGNDAQAAAAARGEHDALITAYDNRPDNDAQP